MHLQFTFQTLYQRPFPTCLAGNHRVLGKTRACTLASTVGWRMPWCSAHGKQFDVVYEDLKHNVPSAQQLHSG